MSDAVIPGWSEGPDLTCALRIAESRDPGFELRTPRNDASASRRRLRGLRLELLLGHHAVTAGTLGLVQRAVAALDHIFHRLAGLELADADRHGDPRQFLAGGAAGDLALRKRAADALSDDCTTRQICIRQNRNQFLAAIAGRQIDFPHPLAQRLGHQPQHLVADPVTKTVVEALEVVDVDQERTERLTLLHRVGL